LIWEPVTESTAIFSAGGEIYYSIGLGPHMGFVATERVEPMPLEVTEE